jgi:hypothetical protein
MDPLPTSTGGDPVSVLPQAAAHTAAATPTSSARTTGLLANMEPSSGHGRIIQMDFKLARAV